MPGGLLDMLGIDPVANRNNRREDAARERAIAAELAVETLRGKNQIGNTRATGDENRKTQNSAAEINKAFEILRSANLMTEKEQEQKLRIMEKDGIVSNRENDKVYDKSLSDTRMRKALQNDAQTIEARSAPGFQQSLNAGMQAANLSSAFDNIAKGTQRVQPGEMLLAPPINRPPILPNAPLI